ncbi:MAG: hypothetical protein AAB929_03200 [Patescibacteria group bacterium]
MFTLKHNLETFFIISLGTALSLFVLVQQNNKVDQRVFSSLNSSVETSLPSPAPSYPELNSVMGSPDGTKSLLMKKRRAEDQTNYSFFTSSSSEYPQLIFARDLDESHSLTVPYNTWSPDNKYFFLKETTPTVNNYFIFNASGVPLKDEIKYINIQDLFSQKQPDYSITDVTGWADPNLIIVNAKKNNDGQLVSFWFEVSSQSFIQLSTYFN